MCVMFLEVWDAAALTGKNSEPLFPIILVKVHHEGNSKVSLEIKRNSRSSFIAQRKRIRLGTMRLQVPSLASLSGLRIRLCCDLWCRSQSRLGSRVAVAVAVAEAGGYSSDWTPSLGTSMCCRCGPQKTKRKSVVERPTKNCIYIYTAEIRFQFLFTSIRSYSCFLL